MLIVRVSIIGPNFSVNLALLRLSTNVCDFIGGFEVESEINEEGERRYKQWEIIGEIMENLGLENGELARWRWGTDDGIFRLSGSAGPYEESGL